jgi:site-specific recombinase XerD
MGLKELQRAQMSIKSVSAPSAHTANLCEVGIVSEQLNLAFVSSWEKEYSSRPSIAFIIWLMYTNGLRISEILSITGRDISRSYNIRIHSKKGSTDRLINASLFASFLKSHIGNNALVLGQFDRFYIYRELKKLGLSYRFEGNQKSSVTHLGRHLFALENIPLADDSMSVGKMLGHKNESNQKYYVKEK